METNKFANIKYLCDAKQPPAVYPEVTVVVAWYHSDLGY